MEIRLYTVASDYIDHLKQYDNTVPNVKYDTSIKPFVGILLEVDELFYLAPITSPKEKHLKISNTSPTSYLIKNNKNKLLGVVMLNNMIPVPSEHLINIDVSDFDVKYANLLNKQVGIIRVDKELIQKKANTLYKLIERGRDKKLVNYCCKFKTLELASKDYMKSIENDITNDLEIKRSSYNITEF